MTRTLYRLLFAAVLLLAALGEGLQAQTVASGEKKLPPSAISSEGTQLERHLEDAASELFGGLPPGKVTFQRLYERPEFGSEAEFEMFAVNSRDKGKVGELLRMRIYQDKDTTLDFALVPGEDRLEKIAAVNEPRLGGKPAGGVTQMLAKLQPYSISKVAQPLSKIFESLVYVAKFSEGERRSRMTPEQIAFLKLSVDKEHPPMPAGARMPAFSGRDLDGKPFSPERFAGKRLIVVAASVMHRMSRDIMGWALRYEQEHPGRFEIADVVYDAEDAVAQYRARGGRFTRIAVLDPDGKLHAAFNVGFVPAVYVFDASGLAVKMLTAPWTDYAAFAAELDAVP